MPALREEEPAVVLVIGSCGLDRLISVDAYPEADAKIRSTAYHEIGGGNAANTASAMALLSASSFLRSKNPVNNNKRVSIQLCTKVGNDVIGRQLTKELERAGVDLSSPLYMVGEEGTTTSFTTIIVSEQEHARTCFHTPGTCGELTAANVNSVDLDQLLRNVVHVHSDSRHSDAALVLAKEAQRRGITVSVDAEKDRHSAALDEVLSIANIVMTNSKQLDDYLDRLTSDFENRLGLQQLAKPSMIEVLENDKLSHAEQNFYAHAVRPSTYFTRCCSEGYAKKQVVITKGDMGALLVQCGTVTRDKQGDGDSAPNNEMKVCTSNSMEVNDFVRVYHRFADRSNRKQPPCANTAVSASYYIRTAGTLLDAPIVDTTGAGDAFIGGYLIAMLFAEFDDREGALQFCLEFGCWVGGKKLGGPGARSALPTVLEVDAELGKDPSCVQERLKQVIAPFSIKDLKVDTS